jgi:hypothetical protein
MIDFDEEKRHTLFKEPEPELAEAVDSEPSVEARPSTELEPTGKAELEPVTEISTAEEESEGGGGTSLLTLLMATAVVGALGLAVFTTMYSTKAMTDGMATPKLESMAEAIDRAAQGLPEDTELFGSFKGNGTVSYTEPESGKHVRAESIEESSSRFEYEVDGTVGDYSILLSYERGSEEHLYSYDSTTDKITESIQEEKN